MDHPKIVILIPCLNEEQTIPKVVADFKRELPEAEIVVYDNNSTDQTARVAAEAGATVRRERRPGKGQVIRTMFREVEADIYIMVDGDDTYPADKVRDLLAPVLSGDADMAVGSRIAEQSKSQFRWVNMLGNKFYLNVINWIFRTRLTDILSGYRCMTRAFVKGLPIFGTGFEIETEITIKALDRKYRIVEVPVDLRARPEGSFSKIRILRDGLKILRLIISLFRDYRPLTFFGTAGFVTMLLGLIPGLIVITEFIASNYTQIKHIPSAILATGMEISGLILVFLGVVLHTVKRWFQELEYITKVTHSGAERGEGDRRG